MVDEELVERLRTEISWQYAIVGRSLDDHHPQVGSGSYVVVAFDPQTGETDCFGPYSALDASADARRRRTELDEADLEDVVLVVLPLTA